MNETTRGRWEPNKTTSRRGTRDDPKPTLERGALDLDVLSSRSCGLEVALVFRVRHEARTGVFLVRVEHFVETPNLMSSFGNGKLRMKMLPMVQVREVGPERS